MSNISQCIVLGTFPFANPFSPVDESAANGILFRYTERGGQAIDTAPTYAFGEVERLVGRYLKTIDRTTVRIATSCGYVPTPNNTFAVSGRYDDVIADCAASMERLYVDYIDVYYSHIPDPATPLRETMDAMCELRRREWIRSIGVSNVSLDQLREYNEGGDVGFVQNRWSMLNATLSDAFVEYCVQHQITLVAYQVLERGILTHSAERGLTLREGDLRRRKPEFAPDVMARLTSWVKEYLAPLAEESGVSVASLVIAYTLDSGPVDVCQCGATAEGQVDDMVQGGSLQIDEAVRSRTAEAVAILEREIAAEYGTSVKSFMGLNSYNLYGGSASGR